MVWLELFVKIQSTNRGKDKMQNPKHTNRNSEQYQIIKTVLNLGNHTTSLYRLEPSAGALRFPSAGLGTCFGHGALY